MDIPLTALITIFSASLHAAGDGPKFTQDAGVTVVTDVRAPALSAEMEHPQACGAVVFDALTSGGGAYCCTGWTVSDGYDGIWEPAHAFTISNAGTICEIDLVLGYINGANSYTVTLYEDEGGLPGAIVQSVAGVAAINAFGNSWNSQAVPFNATVAPGTYWVGVSVESGGQGWGALNWNNNGFAVQMAEDEGAGFYNVGLQNAACWQVYQIASASELDIEFVGPTPAGDIASLDVLYNSRPAPAIDVEVMSSTMTPDGVVTLTLSGRITDTVSDLVADPQTQIRELTISPPGFAPTVIPLTSTGIQTSLWNPHAYDASFQAVVLAQTTGPGGPYVVEFETSPNALGIRGSAQVWIIVDKRPFLPGTPVPAEILSVSTDGPTGQNVAPFTVRVSDPLGELSPDAILLLNDLPYRLEPRDFGDGWYLYPIEPATSAAQVFLPVIRSEAAGPFAPVDAQALAVVMDGGAEKAAEAKDAVYGLFVVTGDSLAQRLNNLGIDNFEEEVVRNKEGTTVGYVYREKNGDPLHHGTSVESEILWRYIRTRLTLIPVTLEGLDQEIAHRKAVIDAARNWQFVKFTDQVAFHKEYWELLNGWFFFGWVVKERDGVASATDAIADMWATPTEYAIACFGGAAFVCLRGASNAAALGKTEFDKRVGVRPFERRKRVLMDMPQDNPAEWIPGDWGWIRNAADPQPKSGLLLGENIIYLGGAFTTNYDAFAVTAEFFGHLWFRKIRTLSEWFDEIKKWDSNKGVPEMTHQRTSIRIYPLKEN